MKKYLVIILMLLSTQPVFADQLSREFHVKRLFSEGIDRAGFYTLEPLPECLNGLMYINLGNESGKAQLSIVMVAKSANLKIVRLDYTVNTTGACYLTSIHIE